MSPEVRQWLGDIQSAISEIQEIAGDAPRTLPNRRRDMLAIERLLTIMGEAMGRIRVKDPQVFDQFPEGRAVIGMRHAITHAYDQIDEELIIGALTEDFEMLSNRISKLLYPEN